MYCCSIRNNSVVADAPTALGFDLRPGAARRILFSYGTAPRRTGTVSIDRPPGIRALVESLKTRLGMCTTPSMR